MKRISISSARGTAALSLALLLAACGGGGGDAAPTTPAPTPTPTPVTLTVTHTVRMSTSKGVIELGLDANHAPVTVANFLKYTGDGYYAGTVFHRVIRDFVIQGGGVTRSGGVLVEKPASYPAIVLESSNGLSNVRGSIAMARTSDPNSATSQFFINTVDNSSCLDRGRTGCDPAGNGYAVFGKVTAGLEVVDAIRAVATNSSDVPLEDVTIIEVKEVK